MRWLGVNKHFFSNWTTREILGIWHYNNNKGNLFYFIPSYNIMVVPKIDNMEFLNEFSRSNTS